MNKLPSIPQLGSNVDPNTRRAIDAIRSWLTDLAEGRISVSSSSSGGSGVTTGTGSTGGTGGTVDLSIPPQVTDLQAIGAFRTIGLSWTDIGVNLSHYEIWRANTNDIGARVFIGTTGANIYTDSPEVSSGANAYWYWVRAISAAGVPSSFSDVATDSTANDPGYLLTVLTGQVTESQLHADLTTRLDDIDGVSGTTLKTRLGSAEGNITSINTQLLALSASPWSAATTYAIDALVEHDAKLYKSLQNGNLNQDPTTQTAWWDKISDTASLSAMISAEEAARIAADSAEAGLRVALEAKTWVAAWSSVTTYAVDALVSSSNKVYKSKQNANTNHLVTDTAWWLDTGVSATSVVGMVVDEASTRASSIAAEASKITGLQSVVGFLPWDQYRTYALNEYAVSGAKTYKSIQSGNLGKTPASNPTWWQLYSNESNSLALLLEEKTTRASQDTAISSSVTTLSGRVGTAEGKIATEQSVRATVTGPAWVAGTYAKNVVVVYNDKLWQSQKASNASTPGANADWKEITSSVYTQYTVKSSVTGPDGKPKITGFGFSNDGEIGRFEIVADNFAIHAPPPAWSGVTAYVPGMRVKYTYSSVEKYYKCKVNNTNIKPVADNGTPATTQWEEYTYLLPFTVDSVWGGAVMDAAFIKDATITSAKIGSLATDKLVATGTGSNASCITEAMIADASISNAKIKNTIQSTDYNEGAGTGWMIDKNGNAKFFNVTARGLVEASSLKANTAMINKAHIHDLAVETLKIKGNAVTVPQLAYNQLFQKYYDPLGSFSAAITYWRDTGISINVTVDTELSALGSQVTIPQNAGIFAFIAEPASLSINKYMHARILRGDGLVVAQGSLGHGPFPAGGVEDTRRSLTLVTNDYLTVAGVYTYYLQISVPYTNASGTIYVEIPGLSLFILATKR